MKPTEPVVIVDYGIGNTASLQNMIRHVGGTAITSSDPSDVLSASALVLPGVGAFDRAMGQLANGPLFEAVVETAGKTPILGVCLGMHLLFDGSEEGSSPGLGLIPGEIKRFDLRGENAALRVPHMGWNIVKPTRPSTLLSGDSAQWKFYFAHSYHVCCSSEDDVVAEANYGYDFPCVVRRGNVFGAQFHPEKSHSFGKRFFENFLSSIC